MTERHPRFLVLAADYPWPTISGTRVRTAGIVDALRTMGTVDILAVDHPADDDGWETARARVAERYGRRRARAIDLGMSLVHGYPTLLERAVAAGLAEAFEGVVRRTEPDVIVLLRPFVGPFLDRAADSGASVVVDADESLVRANRSIMRSGAPLERRARAVVDVVAAARVERSGYRRAHQVWVSSEIERDWFVGRGAARDVHVIPNLAPGSESTGSVGEVIALAFVGYYRYPPNEEAALELMTRIAPAVRAGGGPSPVHIIGREPTEPMRRAAAADTETTILGEVDDSTASIREAGVLVVPIRSGAGARVKVLEAMAAGVPVVSTAKGVEGLGVADGIHFLAAESPDDFARQVARVRDDETLRGGLAAAGRAFIEEHHSGAAVTSAVRAAVTQLPGVDLD